MKKLLSMLLILMLTMSLTACGGGGEKQNNNENPSQQQEEVEVSPWMKTKTGQFYSQFKNGTMYMKYETNFEGYAAQTVTAIKDGKSYSETVVNGKSAGATILDGEYMYNIDHASKAILKMKVDTTAEEMNGVLIEEEDVTPEDLVQGTYTIDNKTYETEEWVMAEGKSILCFDGDKLAYIVGEYEGDTVAMKVVEYSDQVDNSLFELPIDYEVMEF